MRQLFKSKFTFLLAVILLVTVAVGATFAFIVAVTEPLRNLFTDAHVSCTTTYNADNDTWTITNDGDVEAYIRVAVVPYLTNESDEVFWDNPVCEVEYNDGSKWTVIGDHGYHYYKIPLPVGESIVFGTVTVNTDASGDFDYNVTKVTVNAEAFQVGSDEALADAWNVTYTEGTGFAAVSGCTHSRAFVNIDDEYHKYCCTKCGIVYGFARHSLTNGTGNTDNGDGTHSGQCACGYTVDAVPHIVSYTYIDGATHTKFCTLCDWTQTVSCSYDTAPIVDVWGNSTAHRRVCVCGAGQESEDHTLTYVDQGNGTHKRWCAICGYVAVEADHTTTLTGITDTQHTYSCSHCDYSVTEDHDLQTASVGDSGHRATCSVCAYNTDITEHAMSVYTDNGNGKHTVKCASCEYSAVEDHNLTGTYVSDTEHTAACSNCTYSETLTHNYAYEDNGDGTTHTVTCSLDGCTYENATAEHEWEYEQLEIALFNGSGVVNGEKHTARCKWCDYSKEVEHNFTYTRADDATHNATCQECGYTKLGEEHEISKFVKNDGTHHTYQCLYCEQTRELEHDITYLYGDASHTAKCDTCGFTALESEPHNFFYTDDGNGITHTVACDTCKYSESVVHRENTYDTTDTTHTVKCSDCGRVGATNDHTKGYSNPTAWGHTWTCSVCKHSVTEEHDGNATCICGYVTVQYEKQYSMLSEDMQPVLAGNNGYVWEESVMFIDKTDGYNTKQLLYPIDRVISVEHVDTQSGVVTTYKEGIDYTVVDGKLVITENSSIPVITAAVYNDPNKSPSASSFAGFGVYGGEGDIMTQWQVRVTYKTTGNAWDGAEQLSHYHSQYAEFIQKLRNGENVTVLFFGDSITWGSNASYNTGYYPDDGYSYSLLLTQALADLFDYQINYIQTGLVTNVYGNPQQPPKVPTTNYTPSSGGNRGTITYVNTAVGGWTSTDAANNLANYLCHWTNTYGCDLLVVAFGMNDGAIEPTQTATNVYHIVRHVKEYVDNWITPYPNAAVMLVSTMIPNPDSALGGTVPATEQWEKLRGTAARWSNTAVVDMTSISQSIYNRKGLYADYSGNNVNHPNDFLHRIYAQTLLDALIGYENIEDALVNADRVGANHDAYSVNGVDASSDDLLSLAGYCSIGIQGWAGYTKPIAYYGYRVDGGTTYWTSDTGVDVVLDQDAIVAAGGEHAKRYHIQVCMRGLAVGSHTVEFFVMVSDGSIHSLHTLTANVTTESTITPLIVHANEPHSLDGFTTNGNTDVRYDVQEWHNVGYHPKIVDITTNDSAGLYGWIALNSGSPVVGVGYYWDTLTDEITWLDGLGADTDQAVIDAGGAHARRFHINVPMNTAPTLGQHSLHYVCILENWTIIELECWNMNIVS